MGVVGVLGSHPFIKIAGNLILYSISGSALGENAMPL